MEVHSLCVSSSSLIWCHARSKPDWSTHPTSNPRLHSGDTAIKSLNAWALNSLLRLLVDGDIIWFRCGIRTNQRSLDDEWATNNGVKERNVAPLYWKGNLWMRARDHPEAIISSLILHYCAREDKRFEVSPIDSVCGWYCPAPRTILVSYVHLQDVRVMLQTFVTHVLHCVMCVMCYFVPVWRALRPASLRNSQPGSCCYIKCFLALAEEW